MRYGYCLTFSVVVTAGAGSVSIWQDKDGLVGEVTQVGITPPAASPSATGSYYVQDHLGRIPDSGNFSGRQNFGISRKVYAGATTFYITGASADGTYSVDLWCY